MLNILIDSISLEFHGQDFQQTVKTAKGAYYAPLVADLCLLSCEVEFNWKLVGKRKQNLVRKFNFKFRYIDDGLTFNSVDFDRYVHLTYQHQLEIKATTYIVYYVSYLDIPVGLSQYTGLEQRSL